MKVVIFGADQLGVNFYFDIRATEEVIAFIDNDARKQGKEVFGIKIYPVNKLLEFDYGKIYIASCHDKEIQKQILEMGICLDKISFLPIQYYNITKISEKINEFDNISKKEKFDDAWKKIKAEYKTIKVYELRVDAIGEFITRFFMVMNTGSKEKILNIFIPDIGSTKRICNKFLIHLLGRKIHIVQDSDAAFWTYILKTHKEEVDVSEYKKYSLRSSYPAYQRNTNENRDLFYDAEINEGEAALRQMRIKKPFVCFSARSSVYNKRTIGSDYDYDFRNMRFDDYKLALQYLQHQNFTAVKMGRMESPTKEMGNYVDYAGLYADDFMDLYIASECEFMVANSTGIMFMASLFSKPVLVVNAVPVCFGYGGVQYTDRDIYIPKKYYDINRNRLLTLQEMMEVELECKIWGKRYQDKGISFIDNTPEEILSAVQEMYERVIGTWKDSVEDQRNYERYLQVYQDIEIKTTNNPEFWTGCAMPQRIAATYLRDNLYLL